MSDTATAPEDTTVEKSPDLFPDPVVESTQQASDTDIEALMTLSMPPFENFLAHCAALKEECDKAGELNNERARLFDEYRDALLAARGEYEDLIKKIIREQLDADTVKMLVSFYSGPMHKAVERAIGLGPVVNNIGTVWTTKVLERCPDTWKMLVSNVGAWQQKNTPEGFETILPDGPPGTDGWKPVAVPTEAEEFVPPAPEEEAELARMRAGMQDS